MTPETLGAAVHQRFHGGQVWGAVWVVGCEMDFEREQMRESSSRLGALTHLREWRGPQHFNAVIRELAGTPLPGPVSQFLIAARADPHSESLMSALHYPPSLMPPSQYMQGLNSHRKLQATAFMCRRASSESRPRTMT